MNKHRLLNALFICFTVITLLLSGFVGFLAVTHTKAYAVQSDSMNPAFNKGDAVFVREINTAELREGDIVTVKSKDASRFFTHRITRVDTEKSVVYTKGDNNKSEDPMPADMSQVVGRVWFSLPFLGSVSATLQSRTFLIALAVIAVLFVVARGSYAAVKKTKKGGGKDAS